MVAIQYVKCRPIQGYFSGSMEHTGLPGVSLDDSFPNKMECLGKVILWRVTLEQNKEKIAKTQKNCEKARNYHLTQEIDRLPYRDGVFKYGMVQETFHACTGLTCVYGMVVPPTEKSVCWCSFTSSRRRAQPGRNFSNICHGNHDRDAFAG